jgi:cyclase
LREEAAVKVKGLLAGLFVVSLLFVAAQLPAQDLGPQFKKIKDGIFVYTGKPNESNCTIILTQDGVVLIDSGNNPTDSLAVMKAAKQLSSQPIRFLINTEPHTDHTTGHFVFSPPAIIIAAEGGGDSMRKAYDPERMKKMMADPGELGAASKGYRPITPHIEYRQKMSLNVGERNFQLFYLKNVHSESDSAIWLPKEKVIFTAASIGVKRFNNLRPFVSIPDTLDAIKMMKALGPEIVIPGHGDPGSVQLLDQMERYYNLLLDRVKQMAQQGKSLDEIKKELKMPEFQDWEGKDRFPNNIEAAYRAVKGG